MKKIVLPVLILIFALFLQRGHTATNKMENVSLEQRPDYTAITFSFSYPVKYRIVPALDRKTIKIVLPDSEYNPSLDYRNFAGKRVKNMKFFSKNRTDTIAEILLNNVSTSIYHARTRDGLRLVLRLKSREKLMAITTDVEKERQSSAKKTRDEELIKETQAIFDASGRKLYATALERFQKKYFRKSANLLSKFLKEYPDSIYREKAYFTLAEALYRASKKDKRIIPKAIEAFRIAIALFPESDQMPKARIRMGDLNLDQDLKLESIASYDSLVESYPKSKYVVAALLGKANVYLKRKEFNRAYNEFEKILLLYPTAKEVREARFKIAEAFYARQKYETALITFDDSDKKWPAFVRSNPDTLNIYADTNFRLGKYERALELYMTLINLFPGSAVGMDSVNRIGDIYLISGDAKAALNIYGAQARQKPEDTAGIESRLRIAALAHSPVKIADERENIIWTFPDYFHPLETYDAIIKNHPDTTQARDAMYQKGVLLNQQKRYIESIHALREMTRQYPQTSELEPVTALIKDSLFKMVNEHYSQKGFYSVLATYYENFDPFFANTKDPEIVAKVGDAYFEMGLQGKALDRFRRAAVLDKSGRFKKRLRYAMGRSMAAEKKYDEAIETLAPFMDIMDSSIYAADAMHLLGDIHYDRKDADSAIKAYMRGMAIDPDNPRTSQSAYYMGALFKKKEKYRQAIKYFNKAINSFKRKGSSADPYHVRESYYQLVESCYMSGLYEDAINYAVHVLKRYPNDKQNSWATYIKSSSEARISDDEKAVESLKKLAEKEPDSIYGKVASAWVENNSWKLEHKKLFGY